MAECGQLPKSVVDALASALVKDTGGNASVGVLSFDLHFMINSLGSNEEYVK